MNLQLFTVVVMFHALWTLYLDLNLYYGWQKGGYKAKFTHWNYLLNLLFIVVACVDALIALKELGALRRCLLYFSLTTTLTVDLTFLLILLPRRLLGLEKANQVLSPSSAHKHIINAFWTLGEAGLHSQLNGFHVDPYEFFAWGLVLPMLYSLAYLWFAISIENKVTAERTMRIFRIDLPEAVIEGTSIKDLPNITAIPGEWIYSAFKKRSSRIQFMIAPILMAGLGFLLLEYFHNWMGNETFQLVMFMFITIITPILYIPSIMMAAKNLKKKEQ